MAQNNHQTARPTIVWLAVAFFLLILLAVFIGRYPGPFLMSPGRLLNDALAQRLVFNLRLPRILTAVLLGMSLSAAGAVLQMIFGNPLVEPGFLGVSQGAAFEQRSIITFSGMTWLVQPVAALFALVWPSYLVACAVWGWLLRLILAGIAVSALFSADWES